MSKKIEKLNETNRYVEQTLISLPQSLDLPTEFSVGICTIILLVINLPTNHRKCSISESIVGNFLSVSKFIGNKKILVPIDLLIEKASKKKNYPLHSVGIFLGKISYVILLVII